MVDADDAETGAAVGVVEVPVVSVPELSVVSVPEVSVVSVSSVPRCSSLA